MMRCGAAGKALVPVRLSEASVGPVQDASPETAAGVGAAAAGVATGAAAAGVGAAGTGKVGAVAAAAAVFAAPCCDAVLLLSLSSLLKRRSAPATMITATM